MNEPLTLDTEGSVKADELITPITPPTALFGNKSPVVGPAARLAKRTSNQNACVSSVVTVESQAARHHQYSPLPKLTLAEKNAGGPTQMHVCMEVIPR